MKTFPDKCILVKNVIDNHLKYISKPTKTLLENHK